MNDIPEILANGKKVLPPGIRKEVTPAISKLGQFSYNLFPLFSSKDPNADVGCKLKHDHGEDETSERAGSSHSNNSFGLAIRQVKKSDLLNPTIKNMRGGNENGMYSDEEDQDEGGVCTTDCKLSKAEELEKLMQAACGNELAVDRNLENNPIIKEVKKKSKDFHMETVDRYHTQLALTREKAKKAQIENKYNPNYKIT